MCYYAFINERGRPGSYHCGEPGEETEKHGMEVTAKMPDSYEQKKKGEATLTEQKKQGEFTLEDYYALPDEQRVDLIDGVFYDMEVPYTTHQIAVAEIGRQLDDYIRDQGDSCKTMISPVDVQLECDDRTMVQPDILVVCDRDKIKMRCVYGAPDFIVEILSEPSAYKDTTLKLMKYFHAGVREYWMVDLENEVVVVYDMTGGDCYTYAYKMDQLIPVRIFGGKCQIHFDEICEEVRSIVQRG
ncbi:MAG: Uma2 family endonuclease [Lachnospiraceae bacterium]|nr:Uma2 family endonuclease [Lachnospiraceae bacterium]